MALVAFWGPYHGQVGTTSNVVCASTMIGLEYEIKTLIAHTHYKKSRLESSFIKEEEKLALLDFQDTGIDALERLARSNHLTRDNIFYYTHALLGEHRLDMLNGTSKPTEEIYENINDVIPQIIETAKSYYDLTLVDINSGSRNVLSKKVLSLADLIVVNLNQNLSLLEEYFNGHDIPEELRDKKTIFVLGQYDQNSKYTVRNITKRFAIKDKIYVIPHNTEFMDACNDKDVLEYFKRNQRLRKDHNNYYFIQEVRSFVMGILEVLGIDASGYTEREVS